MPSAARNLANLLGGSATIPQEKLGSDISTIEQVATTAQLSDTGNSVGDQRVVGNNLYIWNGSGWFSIALINETPTWDSGGQPLSSYDLSSDSPQTATTITLAATDPDGFPINYSYVTSGQMDSIATISQDSSVFTITPKTSTQAPDGGTGTITFRASDGVNILPQVSSFTLEFPGQWSLATQQARLTGSLGSQNHRLSYCALSADGNTAVGGAYYNDRIYIFTRSGSTWSEQFTVQESGDFGVAVDISADGNTVVVGDRSNEKAYIYTRSGTTWSEQQQLQSSDGLSNDYFGTSVSISDDGNTVVVGAYAETTTQDDSGAAYIFTRSGTTWSEQQKIKGSDVNRAGNDGIKDYFGTAVGISGDGNTIIVGAPWWDGDYAREGAAYIFTKSGSTWSEQTILFDDMIGSPEFGNSVHLTTDGNTAIVATDEANGKVYIFTRSGTTWSQQQILTASDATNWDSFGKNISISGDGSVIIVGAPNEGEDPNEAGAVYIFTKTDSTWTEVKKMQAGTPIASDRFGWDVDISRDGQTAIVGAIYEDEGSFYSVGAVYIFVPG
jgi:hypothetical protein